MNSEADLRGTEGSCHHAGQWITKTPQMDQWNSAAEENND